MRRTIKLFWERELDEVQASVLQHVRNGVQSENQNYLLNVNEGEYVAHLVAEAQIEPLVIDFDGLHASATEKMIPAERFPRDFHVFQGKSYPKQVVRYHLPFSGDSELLRCTPNSRVMNTMEVEIEDGAICFEVINFRDEPEPLKRAADSNVNLIRQQYQSVAAKVARFNASIPAEIASIVSSRRAQIMQQQQFMSTLGVPLKKSANVPATFAVPASRKKIHLPKPSASTKPYAPDPTLDEGLYNDILRIIHDTGKVFERHPSTSEGKGEEDLRDFLLLQLTPHFELTSTTGETVNKSGKTDILIRYDNSNVFVAECKFWKGEKVHHATIDQLLSYLTWRDSKASIVYFVPTKEMAAPLKAIEDSTPKHPCFLAAKGKRDESWFHFDFHLPGDNERVIHVAVLCFHLPQ